MGWKNLKEHFGIEHIVHVTEKGICIGSGYVHDLAVVDPVTGKVLENQNFPNFLPLNYRVLINSPQQEILRLIQTPDTFSASIPVYTYEGSEIIEKQCEVLDWPNVTHDGCLMYENSYSADKAEVVGWAKRNVGYSIENYQERIAETEKRLAEFKSLLAESEADQAKLESDYPQAG